MTFKEPIIIAVNLYIGEIPFLSFSLMLPSVLSNNAKLGLGYVYALLYSYFESFPLVYGPEGYDFPGGVKYLPFAALLVGEAFSFAGYAIWAWYVPPLIVYTAATAISVASIRRVHH